MGLMRVAAVRGVVAPAEGAWVVGDGVAVVNDVLVTAVSLDAGGLFEYVWREGTETIRFLITTSEQFLTGRFISLLAGVKLSKYPVSN